MGQLAILMAWLSSALSMGCLYVTQYSAIDLDGSYAYLNNVNAPGSNQREIVATTYLVTQYHQPIVDATIHMELLGGTFSPEQGQTEQNGRFEARLLNAPLGQHDILVWLIYGQLRQQVPGSCLLNVYQDDGQGRVFAGTALNAWISKTALLSEQMLSFSSSDPLATLPDDFAVSQPIVTDKILPNTIVLRSAGIHHVESRYINNQQLASEQSFTVRGGDGIQLALEFNQQTLIAGEPIVGKLRSVDRYGNLSELQSQGEITWYSSDANAQFEWLTPSHQTSTSIEPLLRFTSTTSGIQSLLVSQNKLSSNTQSFHILPANLHHLQSSTPDSFVAGQWVAPTVKLLDRFNNPLSHQQFLVQWRALDANAIVPTAMQLTTDEQGMMQGPAQFQWTLAGQQWLEWQLLGAGGQLTAIQELHIQAEQAYRIDVVRPFGQQPAGQWVDFDLQILDRYDNIATGYAGQLQVHITDPQASFPSFVAITSQSQGKLHLAHAIKMKRGGLQHIDVQDSLQWLLPEHQTIEVTVGTAVSLELQLVEPTFYLDQPFAVHLNVRDAFGNLVPNYSQTVSWQSSDANASLPQPYTFVTYGSDAGHHEFTDIKLHQAGTHWLEISDGTLTTRIEPIVVHRILSMAVGRANHTCARLEQNQIKCWGSNSFGELGHGDRIPRGLEAHHMGSNLPAIDLGQQRSVQEIAIGPERSCALLDNQQIKCWGSNSGNRSLGLGDSFERGINELTMGDNLPTIDLGNGRSAHHIALNSASICAILDTHQLKCWGGNSFGSLGLGDNLARGNAAGHMGDNLPVVSLGTLRTVLEISGGSSFHCALLDDNTIKCWGEATWGKLGQGQGATAHKGSSLSHMGDNLPIVLLGTNRFAQGIYTTDNTSCALLDDGTMKCWGINQYGELGSGVGGTSRGLAAADMGDNLQRVALGSQRTVMQASTGSAHLCVLLDTLEVTCWGYNFVGQLGNNNRQHQNTPPPTTINLGTNLAPIAQLVSYQTFNCALMTDGRTKCWGHNGFGQLGLGDGLNRGDGQYPMGDALPEVKLW